MKRASIVSSVFFVFFSLMAGNGPDEPVYGALTVVEPVSKTEFKFDEAALQDSSEVNYRKAYILTPASAVSIYSMPNPDDKPFTWARINQFDADGKYGTLVKKHKLENVEGWIRYYENTDKKGRAFIDCITLVRGNAYALYLRESAYKVESLVTPAMIEKTQFGQIDGVWIRNDGSLTWKFWVFSVLIVALAGVAKLIFGREITTGTVVMGVISVIAYGAGLYFWMLYKLSITLWSMFVVAGIWLGISISSTWSDFFRFVEKAFEKID